MIDIFLGDYENLWYSWNIANIHFVSYSTEVVFFQQELIDIQMKWLEKDLAEANMNRTEQPWIIAYGHRYFS